MSLLLNAAQDNSAQSNEPAEVIQQISTNRRTAQHWQMIAIAILLLLLPAPSFGQSAGGATQPVISYPPIPAAQRRALMQIGAGHLEVLCRRR